MKQSNADIEGEYGPFGDIKQIHGVTYDGQNVWFASGEALVSVDPQNGNCDRTIKVSADAGTAFDGTHFYQIGESRIFRIDAQSGAVLGDIPAPDGGAVSGMAWAEGYLWIGQYRDRKIHQVSPETGEILRTVTSDRFVTGVTWIDDQLWHGTWEDEKSDLRHIDSQTGEVLEKIDMPDGLGVSGLESDGKDRFFCGGGNSGKIRVVRRPN